MKHTKHRFLLYAGIGLVFGVFDWFYLDWLAHVSWGNLGGSILVVPIILALNFGIWLVPIIPVVLVEARRSEKVSLPMIAGVWSWSFAIFSYYGYYAILLSLGKLIHLEHLNIFGDRYEAFWPEYWQMFDRIILDQFLEWIIVALVGGAVMGVLAFWFSRKVSRTRAFLNQES